MRMCLAESKNSCASAQSTASSSPFPRAWLIYRDLVRARLYETIEHAFPRLATRLGEGAFCALVAQFLSTATPCTRLLRLVPREFLAFLELLEPSGAQALALPEWALELARFEWLELEVAYEDNDDAAHIPLDGIGDQDRIVATRACRVRDLTHTVHRVSREEPHMPIAKAAATVCIYRDRTTFEVKTLELSAPAAALLRAAAAPGGAIFSDFVRSAADASGDAVDISWLEAFASLTLDFASRGILQRGHAA